jgi:hypothetical protein
MDNFVKEIVGFPGYFITRDGRVFSYKRSHITTNYHFAPYWLQLVQDCMKSGYLRVHFARKNFLVHRLVAIAFIENPNNWKEVNHKDGNKAHNHEDNLEWTTRSLNLKHAFAIGLCKPRRGSDASRTKLTEQQVIAIKQDLEKLSYLGMVRDIAKKYGVVPEAISAIKHGKNWRHITIANRAA